MSHEHRVVDADGHHVERAADLAEHGWDRSTTGHQGVDFILQQEAELRAVGLCEGARPHDAEGRLADMDKEGIAVSVNYPTALLLINQLAPDVAAELSHAYNNWAYEAFTVPTHGRVLTMAALNIAEPPAAVAEARRAVVELGAPGLVVTPYAGHLHLDDPTLDPLWALAEELDVPVGIHGGRSTTAPLLVAESFRDQRRYYAMAHPFGQMVAMGDVMIGGVLDRFPHLRFAFLEAGVGWVPWYIARLDTAAAKVRQNDLPAPAALPSEYLKRGNCFISCEPDEPNLENLIGIVGDDNVVFSSDYPHFDCAFPESVHELTTNVTDDRLIQKVTMENPRRLYRSVAVQSALP